MTPMSKLGTLVPSFRLSLVALTLGLAIYFVPFAAQKVYAQENGCSAECRQGKCSATGATCSCTCSFWFGIPECTCSDAVAPPGGGG